MKYFLSLTLSLIIFSFAGFGQIRPLPGILLTVNQIGDTSDANPGNNVCADANGKCTLRAAVEEANARPGEDVINFTLPLPAVIDLTHGEISITENVSIVGPRARSLTVERSSNANVPHFRIFNIRAGSGNNIHLRSLKIKNGFADAGLSGGAINIETGNAVNLIELGITGNSATDGGGSICNAGTLHLTRSLVNSNGSGTGGGIINSGGSSNAVISNTTITDNFAGRGGGLANDGKLVLVNVTVAGNRAVASASSLASRAGGSVFVVNSIIGNDFTSSQSVSSLTGAFNSLGNNIVTDARESTGFVSGTNNDQVSEGNAINPLLGSLSNNGGLTDTMALLSGSPAIDRGSGCVYSTDCKVPNGEILRLSSDQRSGYDRYQNRIADIGAFEAGANVIGIGGSARLGFLSSPDGPRFSNNALVILTSATDGSKQYSVMNPIGIARFQNIRIGDVYIVEIKGKQNGVSQTFVIPFDDVSFGSPALTSASIIFERGLYKFTFEN